MANIQAAELMILRQRDMLLTARIGNAIISCWSGIWAPASSQLISIPGTISETGSPSKNSL
jgi:hypothetical protein